MPKHLKTAWSRITRAPYQTLAAVSIMTMTLFLACVFILMASGSQAILTYFESRPQINAFYKPDVVPAQPDIDNIKQQLESTGKVSSFKYISKDDALKIYQDLNKSDPLLIEAVTANMLPASIEVSAVKPADLKSLADQLKTVDGMDDVRYAEDIVSSLTRWTGAVRKIGIALVGVNILITLTIILLIIGIKVSNRREEISTLQLVGATSGFIMAPFVWEGILYGVFGAVLAWGITYLLLLYSMGFLVSFLAGIPILPPPFMFMLSLLGIELLIGICVGSLGGLMAVRRLLKA